MWPWLNIGIHENNTHGFVCPGVFALRSENRRLPWCLYVLERSTASTQDTFFNTPVPEEMASERCDLSSEQPYRYIQQLHQCSCNDFRIREDRRVQRNPCRVECVRRKTVSWTTLSAQEFDKILSLSIECFFPNFRRLVTLQGGALIEKIAEISVSQECLTIVV